MSAASRDTETDSFEACERRLVEWGQTCRKQSAALGMPASTGIARMIDRIKHNEEKRKRQQKGVTPTALKQKPDEQLTAKGKQTPVFKSSSVEFASDVVQVDAVIGRLPGWMKKTILRTYLWNQPHRIAARQLRMDEEHYRSQWKAAVKEVAKHLAERGGGRVK